MCLIYLAHRVDPFYRLVVAANRDEFHGRPTDVVHWWDDSPGILAGRDRQAGGTWMGVTRHGRFAALTNFRDPRRHSPDARSRGFLVSGFLRADVPAMDYLAEVAGEANAYNGFSLLVYDGSTLGFFSNQGGAPERVGPGVHGLSNHLLDSPWPKVEEGKLDMLALLSRGAPTPGALLGLLDRRDAVGDADLPDTGVGVARERSLSPRFILGAEYGTRCSTVIIVTADGEVVLRERQFDAAGEARGDEVHSFRIDGAAGHPRASA